MRKNKKSISITLTKKLCDIMNKTVENKSKYIEYCIIEELCKNTEYKIILKKEKIIW